MKIIRSQKSKIPIEDGKKPENPIAFLRSKYYSEDLDIDLKNLPIKDEDHLKTSKSLLRYLHNRFDFFL